MAHDVFISHSSADKPIADAVCATLEGRGIRCWIAPRDILAGVPYAGAITQALKGSRLLVLVFSAHANDSDDVAKEVGGAYRKGLTVVPFRIEDVPMSDELEYHLSSTHWLDALTPPLEQHMSHLAETVSLLLERMAKAPEEHLRPRLPGADEGPGADLSSWAGYIVQWSEDPKAQKTAWYVTSDLQRLWIPDPATFDGLKSMGAPGPVALPGVVLDQMPDQIDHWAATGDRMSANRTLRRGMHLSSADRRYCLVLQNDGNLVLQGPSGQALWANDRFDTAFVVLQGDGDLVGYRSDGTANWASGTAGTGATQLVVQNDGNAVITTSAGKPVWSTEGGGPAARAGGRPRPGPDASTAPTPTMTAKPTGKITVPKSGGGIVSPTPTVAGSLSDVPPGKHIWVAAKVGDLLWPKEPEIDARKSEWEIQINQPPDVISLVLLMVDDDGSRSIRKTLKDCGKAGDWPGMTLSQIPGGASLLDAVQNVMVR